MFFSTKSMTYQVESFFGLAKLFAASILARNKICL